jgi:hypothetical protein
LYHKLINGERKGVKYIVAVGVAGNSLDTHQNYSTDKDLNFTAETRNTNMERICQPPQEI